MKNMIKKPSTLLASMVASTLLFCAPSVMAADFGIEEFFPSAPSGSACFPNCGDEFRSISEELGAAYHYKAIEPAEANGITGFNVNAFVSYTPVENKQAFQDLTNTEINELGMVGISANKGLPFGFDLGGFYAVAPGTDIKVAGIQARYAYNDGGIAMPAISVRLAATKLLDGVDDFKFSTQSADISISKGFLFITPYVGLGQVFTTSEYTNETEAQAAGLKKENFSQTKYFGGVRFDLGLIQFNAEIDRTGNNTSYNLRGGIGF